MIGASRNIRATTATHGGRSDMPLHPQLNNYASQPVIEADEPKKHQQEEDRVLKLVNKV